MSDAAVKVSDLNGRGLVMWFIFGFLTLIVFLLRIAVEYVPFTVDGSALLRDSAFLGLGLMFVFVLMVLYLLGRSSRAHLVLIELMVVGLFGLVSTVYVEMRGINIELDTSMGEVFQVKALGKHIEESRRRRNKSKTYYL